jgi:hypothetical protein
MLTLVFLCLFSHCYCGLGPHYTLVPLEVSIRHVQTISSNIQQVFLQLMVHLAYHVYHCRLNLFYAHCQYFRKVILRLPLRHIQKNPAIES